MKLPIKKDDLPSNLSGIISSVEKALSVKLSIDEENIHEGVTNKLNLSLYKEGIKTKKLIHAQVYGMSDKYELNMYNR
jgi:hypothetical protein